MIVFSTGSWRFTYRVGAIIIRDGHVLLMRMGANDFWFVPGGRVEAGEVARVALEREVTEELGVTGEVGRLLWPMRISSE
jgi:ADP-ribose pyrophosphatase YjhB (NUDIX family)